MEQPVVDDNDQDDSTVDDDKPSEEEDSEEGETPIGEPTIIENSGDSNVEETYTNESWKPVGTVQTGEHVATYDMSSIDWKEMETALAYGARIAEDDLTVWWLGKDGGPNNAVGTVSPKDKSATYRVYIEWVDSEGWKPIKVEKLKKNDKIN